MRRTRRRAKRRGIRLLRMVAVGMSVVLALMVLGQTAFATTYVITDGDRVVTYTTFATDPAQVLDQAGLTLSENDTYTTEAVNGARTISVCRAQSVTVEYHGQTTRTIASGGTAGELLSRLNLDVSGEDVVTPGLETQVYDGMRVRVDRVVTREETYTTTVPHDVRRYNDASLPTGVETVLVEGEDGELLCTASVTYVNGVEKQRQVLTQTQTRAPVTQIVGVGTGGEPVSTDPLAGPVIADGYITLPTGEVLTYTDTATIRATAYTHTDAGCDLITATGTTVHQGTVAVDPRYIPYGTRMFIVSNDGAYVYGVAVAEDCGGDIKGDRMDLYFPTYEACMQFGRRVCTIYFLG